MCLPNAKGYRDLMFNAHLLQQAKPQRVSEDYHTVAQSIWLLLSGDDYAAITRCFQEQVLLICGFSAYPAKATERILLTHARSQYLYPRTRD